MTTVTMQIIVAFLELCIFVFKSININNKNLETLPA